ncbi:hypothetical protein CC86DRAFT_365034 [Ophiobolus disseminans]|uniref:Uncharacterized protein n=1 Tax=Ophiobolus disseminans TaxID=1469910 RepID=A0A6A7AK18_9PLEO|nr:hypothetical protein CC86DRAFT_365034 [Ophiobolus disseminans]
MSKLDALPLEILLEILEYNTIAHNRCPTSEHPLNAVASANRHLHAVVEEYARGLLKQHANFTPPKNSKTFSCRKKWLAEMCQFCRRKSQRRAILYNAVTCCRLCDKQKYPKMTMTQATKDHYLSKLDLFTPNALHPALPPLTTGLHTVMGSGCTMILECDVLSRKAHIKSLLGGSAETHMQRRPAAHDRIIAHMGLYYCCGNGRRPGGWRKAPNLSDAAMEKAAKSMKTEEGRREYVRRNLEKEWQGMGMGTGRSRDDPLEVDD